MSEQQTVDDAARALWRALCEGDGTHSEALDRAIIAAHLKRYAESGEPTPPATPQQPVGLVCPFCRDDDFDAVGLKLHLTTYCEAYASVEVGNRVY